MNRRLLNAFLFLTCLFTAATAFPQSITISGKVTGYNFGPLEGATVSVKGTSRSVSTNNFGQFKITASESDTVVVSFVDYESKELGVGNRRQLNIVLQPGRINLDSVVVIGYGVQKKRDVTGAISSISGNVIKDLPVQNIAEAIQGRVAGVEVTKESG